jgi:N-acyl-phosphatidylethanolamine-hydrolysing phospholipase D
MPIDTLSQSDTRSSTISITPLSPARPTSSPPTHHVGNPPSSFKNPWPSFHQSHSFWDALRMRFSPERVSPPLPSSRDELVPIRQPNWGSGSHGLKVTWIGHASFLLETACAPGAIRGVRILLDPVFSERMSPVSFLGPKRFSPTPCSIEELPDVDLVVISHDHYDHLDLHTVRWLYERHRGRIHFFGGLGLERWFHSIGVREEDVSVLDWWHGVRVEVAGVGSVDLFCTPAQHFSGRSPFTMGATLWCSWVILEPSQENSNGSRVSEDGLSRRKLYFSGASSNSTLLRRRTRANIDRRYWISYSDRVRHRH